MLPLHPNSLTCSKARTQLAAVGLSWNEQDDTTPAFPFSLSLISADQSGTAFPVVLKYAVPATLEVVLGGLQVQGQPGNSKVQSQKSKTRQEKKKRVGEKENNVCLLNL